MRPSIVIAVLIAAVLTGPLTASLATPVAAEPERVTLQKVGHTSMQVGLSLQPGDAVSLTCTGTLRTVSVDTGTRTIYCEVGRLAAPTAPTWEPVKAGPEPVPAGTVEPHRVYLPWLGVPVSTEPLP